jgi:hypothetical protein
MPLERAWREFFETSAALLPSGNIHKNNDEGLQLWWNKREHVQHLQEVSVWSNLSVTALYFLIRLWRSSLVFVLQDLRNGFWSTATSSAVVGDVIARQQLFSVYLHTPPGYRFSPDSIFAGYELSERVQVHWAQYSVVRGRNSLNSLRFWLSSP